MKNEKKEKLKMDGEKPKSTQTNGKSASSVCSLAEYNACCCTCRRHIPDYSHPITDGKRISEQRGWVCMPLEFCAEEGPIVFSGWPKHGLCEMYEEKKHASR